MTKDNEGYVTCGRCGLTTAVYPSAFCDSCQNVRDAEDGVLTLAANILRERRLWDYGGKGQDQLELLLADRFNMRQHERSGKKRHTHLSPWVATKGCPLCEKAGVI